MLSLFTARRVVAAAAALSLGALGAVVLGCDGDTAEAARDYGTLLQTASSEVAVPAFQAAKRDADALRAAVKSLHDAPSAESLQNAQNAWRAARKSFRALDSFTFGPLQQHAIDVRIDATPAERGGIERVIAGNDALDEQAIAKLGGKLKGYLALEAVLFVAADGSDVLTGFVDQPRRRAYSLAVSEALAKNVSELHDHWVGAGKWAELMQNAGSGNEAYNSQRQALDALVGGGGYALELVVGIRLAMPMGRKSANGPDPSFDPTLASDSGVADMLASMSTVRALYERAMSPMIKAQNSSLDDAVRGHFQRCVDSIDAIPRPYGDSILQQFDKVQGAFDACKALKYEWNTSVTSTLGATVKPLDTDGD